MKTFKKLMILVAVVFLLLVTCIAGQMYCSAPAKASAPGIWVCIASTEKTLEPDYDCDAFGRSRNKATAKQRAIDNCWDKCSAECIVEACARVRK